MKIIEFIKNEKKEIVKSLCFSGFLVLIFIFGVATAYIFINQQNTEDLNDFFYLNYNNFIQVEGASKINQIVQQVDHISSPEEKLNSIANIIVTNFTDPYWSESNDNLFIDKCSANIPFNHRFIGKNCNGFGFDKSGAIRIRSGNLTNNPYWIAYYKTGACSELATLFANVSNQTGFISRVVYSIDPNHAWTEVYLDGEWQYFDPDMYHSRKGNISLQKYWLDNTSSFEKKIGWKFSKILVDNSTPNGYEEDRTKAYTKTGIVKIVLTKPIERIVIRERNHDSFSWTFEPNCSYYPCEIEGDFGIDKKYILQRYLSPGFFFDIGRFSVKENEILTINIDSPLRLNNSWTKFSNLFHQQAIAIEIPPVT